ncbi:hypothetical protein ACP8HI_13390 [Paenibacillus sp. FA6]|uniref:hypothetical protein n=1 Tax=Paenibacillus sp. FA6 TaxID=3413029 RepID=UPI003F659A5E
MHHSESHSIPNLRRLEEICDVRHMLCRDDMMWVLHYVQQKVAQGDPALLELPKPRLLRNFQYFGEVSILLLKRPGTSYLEQDNIRSCLMEAMHGLIPVNPILSSS